MDSTPPFTISNDSTCLNLIELFTVQLSSTDSNYTTRSILVNYENSCLNVPDVRKIRMRQ